MDKNQVYIDRLRKVLWENQEDLKKVTSYDFCTSCQDYVLTSNYCQQCGQMNLSTETVSFGESQSLLDNGQYYMVQSNRWLDRWGLWLEERLNKVGIEINQGTLYKSASYHKLWLISFTFLCIIFQFGVVFPSSLFSNMMGLLAVVFGVILIFTNYQIYKGQTHKVLLGGAGILVISIVGSIITQIIGFFLITLLFIVLPLFLLLKMKGKNIQDVEKSISIERIKNTVKPQAVLRKSNTETIGLHSPSASGPKLSFGLIVKLVSLVGFIFAVIFYAQNSVDGKYRMGYDGVADIELNVLFTMVNGEVEVLGQTQSFSGTINIFDKTINIDLPEEIQGIGSEIVGTYEKDDSGNLKVGYFTFEKE
ncbi:TPA: hypothetical protein U2C79_001884 [Streptococcus suis]|nr:hypothetical protein [Streptococcus suis]